MEEKIDESLDVKGLTCPMPMLKLSKAMKKLESGKVLEMLGTDPGTKTDLHSWCDKTGNTLLDESELEGGVFRFVIKKK
ncbi:MAG: sulfurtransferase TusA family protein [candidate division Zixibacteria bacterium]|nr:sulfurtransferase TusA family protein [candidate division Zixibacteria bacterium]